jgi:hypothetical protein
MWWSKHNPFGRWGVSAYGQVEPEDEAGVQQGQVVAHGHDAPARAHHRLHEGLQLLGQRQVTKGKHTVRHSRVHLQVYNQVSGSVYPMGPACVHHPLWQTTIPLSRPTANLL